MAIFMLNAGFKTTRICQVLANSNVFLDGDRTDYYPQLL